jgi:hypothetical protein
MGQFGSGKDLCLENGSSLPKQTWLLSELVLPSTGRYYWEFLRNARYLYLLNPFPFTINDTLYISFLHTPKISLGSICDIN